MAVSCRSSNSNLFCRRKINTFHFNTFKNQLPFNCYYCKTAMIISSLKFVFPRFTTSISFHVSFFHWLRWTQQIGRLLMFGSSIAQLGKALERYRRGHGFETHWSHSTFFGLIWNCLNNITIWMRLSQLHFYRYFRRIIFILFWEFWWKNSLPLWSAWGIEPAGP